MAKTGAISSTAATAHQELCPGGDCYLLSIARLFAASHGTKTCWRCDGTLITVRRDLTKVRRGLMTVRRGLMTVRRGLTTVRRGLMTVRRGLMTVRHTPGDGSTRPC